MKSREEMQEIIRNSMIYIANNIFWRKSGNYKYVDAYKKLKSQVLIDFNFSINEELTRYNKKVNMFDILTDEEIEMCYKSCIKLLKMYEGVIGQKVA